MNGHWKAYDPVESIDICIVHRVYQINYVLMTKSHFSVNIIHTTRCMLRHEKT